MKTAAVLKSLSKGKKKYIHIYYQSKGNIIRINTGYEYLKSYTKSDGFYNTNKKDYELFNNRMRYMLKKANDYIHYCINNARKIDNSECKEFITGNVSTFDYFLKHKKIREEKKQPSKKPFALDWYEEFYNYKERQLQNKYSLKDYKSLWNVLLDYERDNGRFTFQDMNTMEWLFAFRDYLASPRPDESKIEKHKRVYLSKGNLTDTTINKRIQTLKNWFGWIEKKKLCIFTNEVMKYNVKKGEQEIIALSLDELKDIYYFDGYTIKEKLVIDVFVLDCLTGLRYGDLSSLDKTLFEEDENGNLFYIKYNQKTNVEINVPILPIAREILERYDFQPRVYANAVLNRRIKEVLQKHKLLEKKVYKNQKRKEKTIKYQLLLREAITTHTGRKTFITIAKSLNIPDNKIMAATGHKTLSIMQKYTKKIKDYDAFKGMNF